MVRNMADENDNRDESVIITEVFSDIDSQISSLKKKKENLNNHIEVLRDDLDNIHKKEIELRDKIAVLSKKEPSIDSKKLEIESDLAKLIAKLDKLQKIHGELKEVWS